jgi:CheY-like chemotaxis protein
MSEPAAITATADKNSPLLARAGKANSAQHTQTKRIVVVEDDPLLLDLYPMHLMRFPDFSVVARLKNGKELVDYLAKIQNGEGQAEPGAEVQQGEGRGGAAAWPDLIITDYRMPVMDGLEAAKLARIIRPSLKIILASAYDLPKEDLGYFDAVLRKPFASSDLAAVIESVTQ